MTIYDACKINILKKSIRQSTNNQLTFDRILVSFASLTLVSTLTHLDWLKTFNKVTCYYLHPLYVTNAPATFRQRNKLINHNYSDVNSRIWRRGNSRKHVDTSGADIQLCISIISIISRNKKRYVADSAYWFPSIYHIDASLVYFAFYRVFIFAITIIHYTHKNVNILLVLDLFLLLFLKCTDTAFVTYIN